MLWNHVLTYRIGRTNFRSTTMPNWQINRRIQFSLSILLKLIGAFCFYLKSLDQSESQEQTLLNTSFSPCKHCPDFFFKPLIFFWRTWTLMAVSASASTSVKGVAPKETCSIRLLFMKFFIVHCHTALTAALARLPKVVVFDLDGIAHIACIVAADAFIYTHTCALHFMRHIEFFTCPKIKLMALQNANDVFKRMPGLYMRTCESTMLQTCIVYVYNCNIILNNLLRLCTPQWDPEMYELWGGGPPFKPHKDGSGDLVCSCLSMGE